MLLLSDLHYYALDGRRCRRCGCGVALFAAGGSLSAGPPLGRRGLPHRSAFLAYQMSSAAAELAGRERWVLRSGRVRIAAGLGRPRVPRPYLLALGG